MQTISVRDPLNNQRVFDVTVDHTGEVIIVTKIGKLKVSTPLRDVISIAKVLKPDFAG